MFNCTECDLVESERCLIQVRCGRPSHVPDDGWQPESSDSRTRRQQELIRRWDSKRELFTTISHVRTSKY